MEFGKREIMDLLISTIVLALVFSSFNIQEFPMMIFVIVAVFLSHEILGHKFLAQRYGCQAEYKMWIPGLVLGIITALIPGGIVFAAPGAVYISPYVKKRFAFTVVKLSKREYGLISFGGPFLNNVIGFSMIFANFIYPLSLFRTTALISFYLALFNLIPFPPLDGSKVFSWNKYVWIAITIVSLLGFLFLLFS